MAWSYAASEPTSGLRLLPIAQRILAETVDFYAQNGVALPARQLLSPGAPGQISWDCEQLAVVFSTIGYGRSQDAAAVSASFSKASSQAMRHVTFALQLVRCVPSMADDGSPPSAMALTESFEDYVRDAGMISQVLANLAAYRRGAPQGTDDPVFPLGVSMQAGAVSAYGPEGGLVGLEGGLTMTAGVW